MEELMLRAGGRPTVITDDILSKLKAVLQRGISIKKACIYAGIGEKTFYRHYGNDSKFRQEIDNARNFATLAAGQIVVNDIVENKSVNTSKWWLERKDPEEFGFQSINQNNTVLNNQKNYVFMSNDELRMYIKDNSIDKMDPMGLVDLCAPK